MYSCGPQHMANQKQDDQLEHSYSNYVMIRDVILKTCRRWLMIGRRGERGSGISVLAARHDDNDDDDIMLKVVTNAIQNESWYKILLLLTPFRSCHKTKEINLRNLLKPIKSTDRTKSGTRKFTQRHINNPTKVIHLVILFIFPHVTWVRANSPPVNPPHIRVSLLRLRLTDSDFWLLTSPSSRLQLTLPL